MGLRQLLTAAALRRASVLVVEVPGWGRTRCAVEAELRRRGWRAALSPADADALVICGRPGDRLQEAIELLWEQLPGPRARACVFTTDDVVNAMHEIRRLLEDDDRQRAEATERASEPAMGTPPPGSPGSADETGGDGPGAVEAGWTTGGMDRGGMDHGGMDHGGMDHGENRDTAEGQQGGHEESSDSDSDIPEVDQSHMTHSLTQHGDMAAMDDGDTQGQREGRPDHGGGHGDDMADVDCGDLDHDGVPLGDMASMDHGGMDHGGMDHGDKDHGDMGGMDMPMPAGIPLAGGSQDRDGLEMDVLHVPLGPVLPMWPAGLVLRCTLSGDVVTEAQAEVLEPAAIAPVEEQLVQGSAAERLDRVAGVLALAGWDAAASSAARLRDDVLFSDPSPDTAKGIERLARQVDTSRLLRWSLPRRATAGHLAPQRPVGQLLEDARTALAGGPVRLEPVSPDRLAEQVVGHQLSSVRLLVAAADLEVARVPAGAAAS